MRDPIENVTRLQKQLNNLQLENQVLKNILDKAGLSYQNELASIRKTEKKEDFDPEQGKRIVHPKEITDRMAKLFFSFFWGRTDVYAKRNVNKNGEAAYYPQCDNFWSDNCHRKLNTHIDCKDCKYCSYTRLDLSTILTHLRGNSYVAKDVIGVYPLFSDGTCRFLVFDFDNHEKNAEKRDFANTDDTWIEEVEAMRDICTLNGISDAMRMRGISFGGNHPGKMLEYRLIPLMTCSVKIGDELSAAALTRGLGADVKRTNICKIGFRFVDYIVLLGCIITLAYLLLVKIGGFL